MRCWKRIALGLVCCAALAACKTPETTGATHVDSASCQSSCDAAYGTCANACEQNVENTMCAEECVDTLDSCKKLCR